jgi:hypothetical protein
MLLYEGRDSGLTVHAAKLEAQFLIPPALHLLFFTDNTPYEEELQVMLLDGRLRFMDGVRLGSPYTPGMLSSLQPVGDHQVTFEFFPQLLMELKVHPEGIFQVIRRLPPFAKPLKRRPFSKHYLSIKSTLVASR